MKFKVGDKVRIKSLEWWNGLDCNEMYYYYQTNHALPRTVPREIVLRFENTEHVIERMGDKDSFIYICFNVGGAEFVCDLHPDMLEIVELVEEEKTFDNTIGKVLDTIFDELPVAENIEKSIKNNFSNAGIEIKKSNYYKTSIDFLNESKNIQEERAIAYDSPSGERSMEKTVRAFNIITGHNIKESEGWLFQQILKDVRQWQRKDYHEDSALDCVSYSSLKAEALAKGK